MSNKRHTKLNHETPERIAIQRTYEDYTSLEMEDPQTEKVSGERMQYCI